MVCLEALLLGKVARSVPPYRSQAILTWKSLDPCPSRTSRPKAMQKKITLTSIRRHIKVNLTPIQVWQVATFILAWSFIGFFPAILIYLVLSIIEIIIVCAD
jgi:hypothetical protein